MPITAEQRAKPHLSPTQLDMFTKCPEQYRRRYIEGEKIPPGIAQMKGSALHRGAEFNMRQKIESHVDLPAGDITEMAVTTFEAATHGEYLLLPEERAMGADTTIARAKDSVAAMTEVHARQQAPEYQPVLVEEKVRIALPGPRDLLGIIDLADEQDRVIDFKTASKSKSQSEADTSVQLTVYAAAFTARRGRKPRSLRLDTVVHTAAGKLSRQALDTERDEADIAALANRVDAVSAAIEAAVFPPAPPGAWYCSKKFCGFYATCRYVNAKRITD
jgi:hypothetical protein